MVWCALLSKSGIECVQCMSGKSRDECSLLRGIQLTFLVGRIYVRELTIERVGMRDKN
jgi:hypothetical protein